MIKHNEVNLGDSVWILHHHKAKKCIIYSVYYTYLRPSTSTIQTTFTLRIKTADNNTYTKLEDIHVFLSKQDLLDSL